MASVIGVDGCPAGWFWVGLKASNWSVGIASSLEELLRRSRTPELVLVDIPIGLRSDGPDERRCDKRARSVLGQPRGSSVFPAPCRAAVHEPDPERASDVNEALTGRRLSAQAENLIPKIREIDELLRRSTVARDTVREVHPEVCFWALNRKSSLEHSKKQPDGLLERLNLLRQHLEVADEVVAQALLQYKRSAVARDDVLDALVAAVTALHKDELETLPGEPEHDSAGIPMEMVYWASSRSRSL